MKGARAFIDLAALRYNIERVKQLAPQANILAMVKADAYGHGLRLLAPFLDDLPSAHAFGVARLDEAIVLRHSGAQKPIFLMEGFGYEQELDPISVYDLGLVLHETFQVEILLKHALPKPVPVWLKVNTGMNRLGFSPEKASAVLPILQRHPEQFRLIGVMTHFAKADDVTHPMTSQQIARFQSWVSSLPTTHLIAKSLANSAAVLSRPDALADWVRPGILLYGVSPFSGQTGKDWGLRPVMSFESELIAVYDIEAGETVGYGGNFQAEKAMRIGIVAAGYADGYPVIAPNDTPVWIRDRRCPLTGRVSMDMLAVDLSALPDPRVGERVVLWGRELPLEEVASAMNIIPYSLCTGVTQRVKREMVMQTPMPTHAS